MENDEKGRFLELLGKRIAEVRGRTSQVEFAKEVGIGKNTLYRYEKGEVGVDSFFLAHLCRKYGLNVEWLLLGIGQQRKTNEHHDSHSSCDHPSPLIRDGHIFHQLPALEPGLAAYIMNEIKNMVSFPLSKEQVVDASFLAYMLCQEENKTVAEVVARFCLDWFSKSDEEKEKALYGPL